MFLLTSFGQNFKSSFLKARYFTAFFLSPKHSFAKCVIRLSSSYHSIVQIRLRLVGSFIVSTAFGDANFKVNIVASSANLQSCQAFSTDWAL